MSKSENPVVFIYKKSLLTCRQGLCFLSLTEVIRLQWRWPRFLSILLALQAHTFTSQALLGLCVSHFICFQASRFKSFLSTREESRAQEDSHQPATRESQLPPLLFTKLCLNIMKGLRLVWNYLPCHVPPRTPLSSASRSGPSKVGPKLTAPRAASQTEQPLTCTFLLRLTAGKNRPSTFSNAMGPCCSSLIKNVKVFLLKSRRTPIVAPFVIPPSVLWKKKTRGFTCPSSLQKRPVCMVKPVFLNLFKMIIPYPRSLLTHFFLLVTPPHTQF